jgi:hypothetical protein
MQMNWPKANRFPESPFLVSKNYPFKEVFQKTSNEKLEKKYAHWIKKNGVTGLQTIEIFNPEAQSTNLPVLGLFAGVHGLEAISVTVLQTFAENLVSQLSWNQELRYLLTRMKFVLVPVVNPSGYVNKTRSNLNGVDLMRNAPVESLNPTPFVCGHRISPHLPYFRGSGELEIETSLLFQIVREKLFQAPFALALDVHSGFGLHDSIWTPYLKIKEKLDSALPNHVYKFGPQSEIYRTHGDIWDFLYQESLHQNKNFLPLTLEMGSWNWLKKAPHLSFRKEALFNPLVPHREKRVLRRHLHLLNLLSHMVANWESLFSNLEEFSKVS